MRYYGKKSVTRLHQGSMIMTRRDNEIKGFTKRNETKRETDDDNDQRSGTSRK